MSREPRPQSPDLIFHLINRGNSKQKLFFDPWDYLDYLELLKKYKEKFSIKIYYYVLMPNHVHLLLEPTVDGSLSPFMQAVTLTYAYHYNRKQGKTGHVWQGRFKSLPVEEDAYFLQCGQYMEMNPVRAKLVLDPSQYRWSSYPAHALGAVDTILDEHSLYTELGSTPKERQLEYKRSILSEQINLTPTRY